MNKNQILDDHCKAAGILNFTILSNKKVNDRTMIEFKCTSCGILIKKSFKLLTQYKDNQYLTVCSGLCSHCFRMMHH